MFIENAQTELKETYTEDIKKEIIAFLNSSGGTLYVGISDRGDIVGLADADKTRISIDNLLTTGIYPNVCSLVKTEVIYDSTVDKQYVKCSISEGTDKPYHYKHSRLTSDNVFIRIGSSCVAADDSLIEQMLRESRKSYESLVSIRQGLSFAYADKVFADAGIPFGDSQKISLKVKNASGRYTNLGLLLSDQCPHFIKVAAFSDEDGFNFVTKDDLVGSVFMQLDCAYAFVRSHIKMSTKYEDLKRIDNYEYPLVAIREALLNTIMHRDYGSPSPTQLKVFSNRIEMVSFGGLVSEVTVDTISDGISSCRNPNLAAVLARLDLVESFGTGIPKILAAYRGAPVQPVFSIKPNIFKITLPHLVDKKDSDAPTNLF